MLEIAFAVSKAFLYAAALLGAGIAFANGSLRAVVVGSQDVAMRWAGVTLVVSACALALGLVLRLGGYWDLPTLDAIFRSPLGLGLGLQAAGGAALALLRGQISSIVAAIVVVLGFAVSGHSAAKGVGPALVTTAHVAAAAWWCGGVWLLLAASTTREVGAYQRLVAGFSRQALVVVGGLVLAGAATTFFLLGGLPDFANTYDRALALKVAIASAVLALAAVNKLVLTPRLALTNGMSWFRRSLRAELVLILGVVGATAFMTTFTSPHRAPPRPPEQIVATFAGISVVDPWVSLAPEGVRQTAGYFVLRNASDVPDRLIAVSTTRANAVSLHEMRMDGDMMTMRRLDSLEIPARGAVSLAPGGAHLMLDGLDAPLLEGETIEVTLHFDRRGTVAIPVQVKTRSDGPHTHE